LNRMLDINDDDQAYDAGHLVDNYHYLNQTGLPSAVDEQSKIDDAKTLADAIVGSLNIKGVAINTINVFDIDQSLGAEVTVAAPDGIYSDDDFFDFENLVRLRLIDRTEIKRHKIGIFDIDVHY
jgi:hypothetical protein